MTTIATDGKSMAGDGLTNACGIVTSRTMRKVFRLDDGRVFGACGKMQDMLVVRDWLNGGSKPVKVDDDFGALLLNGDGVQWSDDNLYFHHADVPAAMGSGMALALGAMLAGADPGEAVRIASSRDPFSGGDIIVEHLA